jgi:hypothetical protein
MESRKQILNRAYEIWERNGRPEDEFWHQAEQELRAEEERGDPAKGTPDRYYGANATGLNRGEKSP